MVDLAFLRKFTKGNTAKMKRYISIYLDVAPEAFVQIRQNLDEKNWTQLGIHAHSLKPQAEYMGIAELKEILIRMEDGVKNNQHRELEELYTEALALHKESERILREFLETEDN